MAIAHLEEVLERRAQQVDDHDVVVALTAGPHYPGNARATHESLVYLRFLLQRTVLGNGRLEFYRDFLPCNGVYTEEDLACGGVRTRAWRGLTRAHTAATDSNLLLEPVLAAKSEIHGRLWGKARG
jgi:hypothetical protein